MRTVRWFTVLALALGCTGAPAVVPMPRLPFAVDSVQTVAIAPGTWHRSIVSPTGPWSIDLLEVRLDHCTTLRAVKGVADSVGRRRTSALLSALADTIAVLGGVNADFFRFDPPGVPTGLLVARGIMLTPPSARPVFAVDSMGTPQIAVFRIDPTGRLAPFHPLEAVGGHPVLVREGELSAEARDSNAFAVTRHPRTAVGLTADGRVLLVVVDGRQPGRSVGMSLRELGGLMLALGARDALNLDGGGSTTLVVRGAGRAGGLQVANSPSDSAGERPVGDALAVVRGC